MVDMTDGKRMAALITEASDLDSATETFMSIQEATLHANRATITLACAMMLAEQIAHDRAAPNLVAARRAGVIDLIDGFTAKAVARRRPPH